MSEQQAARENAIPEPRVVAGNVTIDELTLADEPDRWERLGFAVEGDLLTLGTIGLRLAGRESGRGIVGWSLRATTSGDLDGLPTKTSTRPPREPAAKHPNGVSAIDHVVAFSPQLDRTVDALRAAGLDLRRVREQPTPTGAPRQAFFRLGEAILEVVQIPDGELARAGGEDGSARFWGLALIVGDIERSVAVLGEHASEIRAALQAGRRIATLKRSAGLAVPVALMTPR